MARVNSYQLAVTLVVALSCVCLVTSSVLPSDGLGDMDILRLQEVKRHGRDDISKLLLKNMRFRDVDDMGIPMSKRGRALVSNLAALLSGLRNRQAEPTMNMPSLRFG